MRLGVALLPLLFMLFGALAVGGLLYVSIEQAKKRRAALLAWAAGRGWTVVPDASYLLGRWRGAPFGAGRARRVGNAVTGTFAGRPGISFDYQYTTGSGKNRTTHHYHVMVLSMPAPLPHLQLTPENIGTTIAKVFGGEDIEFESEQFNQMWRVQASVPRFAFDVLHPRLMERLLYPDARGPMRIEGSDLVAWRSVELRRRHDLIPNLAETVKGYAQHERQVLDWVTHARAAAIAPGSGPAAQAAQEGVLGQALGRMFAVAESYPALRASGNFPHLQRELVHTEDRIAAGRRFYNANVRQLNTRTETFPSNMVASMFSVRRAEYFELDDARMRSVPQAGSYLQGR